VGRLLYDTKSVLADQIDAVTRASVDKGLDTPDLSLLVDGLRAEREQGITIDVAYRYFATPAAHFRARRHPRPRAVHPQHGVRRVDGSARRSCWSTPATASSSRPGATRRCWRLLGVPQLVLAVNKIDLVDDADERFRSGSAMTSTSSPRRSAGPRTGSSRSRCRRCIGDNVASRSEKTPYYDGPTLHRAPGDPLTEPDRGRSACASRCST
jgi:sulfate adenylyltransferase subunit 1